MGLSQRKEKKERERDVKLQFNRKRKLNPMAMGMLPYG